MNVGFEFSHVAQSAIFFEKQKIEVYENLIDFSKQHRIAACFIGLPVAVCFALVDIAKSISTVAEAIFKGLGNIFGSAFSDKYSLLKGVKQLFVQSSLNLSLGAFTSIFVNIPEMFMASVRMLLSPSSALNYYKKIEESEREMLEFITSDKISKLRQYQQMDLVQLEHENPDEYVKFIRLELKFLKGFHQINLLYYAGFQLYTEMNSKLRSLYLPFFS